MQADDAGRSRSPAETEKTFENHSGEHWERPLVRRPTHILRDALFLQLKSLAPSR
jgi:hypothetical protein